MTQLNDKEIESVSGGIITAIIGVVTVDSLLKNEKNITDFVVGFFEGLLQSQARHQ